MATASHLPLFDRLASENTQYRDGRSGWKGMPDGAGAQAARIMAEPARTLRRLVLAEYIAADAAGLTADEVAARLGKSILSIRPRVAELNGAGLLMPAGRRRRNESGMMATVWKIEPPAPCEITGAADENAV